MVVGPVHCSLQKFILLLNYEMKKVIMFLFFFFFLWENILLDKFQLSNS